MARLAPVALIGIGREGSGRTEAAVAGDGSDDLEIRLTVLVCAAEIDDGTDVELTARRGELEAIGGVLEVEDDLGVARGAVFVDEEVGNGARGGATPTTAVVELVEARAARNALVAV